MKTALVLGCAIAIIGCDRAPADEARQSTSRRGPVDSSSIFGDPGLTPQRDGEHARRELALAGDLRKAIAALEVTSGLEVIVRLPSPGSSAPPRAVVSGTKALASPGNRASVSAPAEARVRAIAVAALPHDTLVEVHLTEGAPAPERAPKRRPALWLAILGLGASLGVAADRAFRRRE